MMSPDILVVMWRADVMVWPNVTPRVCSMFLKISPENVRSALWSDWFGFGAEIFRAVRLATSMRRWGFWCKVEENTTAVISTYPLATCTVCGDPIWSHLILKIQPRALCQISLDHTLKDIPTLLNGACKLLGKAFHHAALFMRTDSWSASRNQPRSCWSHLMMIMLLEFALECVFWILLLLPSTTAMFLRADRRSARMFLELLQFQIQY